MFGWSRKDFICITVRLPLTTLPPVDVALMNNDNENICCSTQMNVLTVAILLSTQMILFFINPKYPDTLTPYHDIMGESSKSQKSWTLEIQILKLAGCLQKWIHVISCLNGKLCLDQLKTNQRSQQNLPKSAFEADFLWKVSLKILNSGLILKTFTHVICNLKIERVQLTT